MIHYGPLLYCDVPGTYPSLYSEGGGLGHRRPETIGGITRRGMKHVLVFILNPKRLHLPLHCYLLHSEGSGMRTWVAISYCFLRVFLLRRPTHRLLSLSVLFLMLVVMCDCICRNLNKRVPQFAYLLWDPTAWRARGNCP